MEQVMRSWSPHLTPSVGVVKSIWTCRNTHYARSLHRYHGALIYTDCIVIPPGECRHQYVSRKLYVLYGKREEVGGCRLEECRSGQVGDWPLNGEWSASTEKMLRSSDGDIVSPEESLIGVQGSRKFSIAATAGQRDDLACFRTGRRGKNVFKKRENRKDLPFYICPSRFLIRNIIHCRT